MRFDKQRAREICEPRLTPAPWSVNHDDEGSTICGLGRVVARLPYNRNPWDHDDAIFIAESRTLLPAALARVEELEAGLSRAIKVLNASSGSSDALDDDIARLRSVLSQENNDE